MIGCMYFGYIILSCWYCVVGIGYLVLGIVRRVVIHVYCAFSIGYWVWNVLCWVFGWRVVGCGYWVCDIGYLVVDIGY